VKTRVDAESEAAGGEDELDRGQLLVMRREHVLDRGQLFLARREHLVDRGQLRVARGHDLLQRRDLLARAGGPAVDLHLDAVARRAQGGGVVEELAPLDVSGDQDLGGVLRHQRAVFRVKAAQRRGIVVPAEEALVQRVGPDAVLERGPRQVSEPPAALRRAEPEVPVLPVGERDVVAVAVAPDGAAHDGTGVDVIAPEQPRELELRYGDVAGARAELAPVAVDHPEGGICIEQRHRVADEPGQQPVVGVERQEIVAGRRGNPRVAGGREAGVRLFDDAMSRLAKSGEHLSRPRLRRPVVDDDHLRLGRIALGAGDGVDQIFAVVVTRDDHREPRLCDGAPHGRT
jgi:hypothetical protein